MIPPGATVCRDDVVGPPDPEVEAAVAALRAWLDEHPRTADSVSADVTRLLATLDPRLPMLTRVTMAGDIASAEQMTAAVRDGVPWPICAPLVGSYAKVGWLLDMADAGHATRSDVLALLPWEWPHSDPDDTDPRFLSAWSEAWQAAGRRTLLDDPTVPLPPGRHLTIYRGQGRADRPGIAWSLRRDVAEKFANGASLRVEGAVRDPVLLAARVHRRMVLAYLSTRNEEEVIVNPFMLNPVES